MNWIKITPDIPIPHGHYFVYTSLGQMGFATYGQYKMSSPVQWYDKDERSYYGEITHYCTLTKPTND